MWGYSAWPVCHSSESSPFPGARFNPDMFSVLERRKGGIIRWILGEVSGLLPVGLQNGKDKTTTLTILEMQSNTQQKSPLFPIVIQLLIDESLSGKAQFLFKSKGEVSNILV